MKIKKYLSIELTPGRAFVSCINEGNKKKKIYNTFVVTFSESCYSNGMYYDTNQEISAAIKNSLIEHKIHIKTAVITVYSPFLKTDSMEVPASAKKNLKQFVRQQLYSKNQVSGDYVVDAVQTDTNEPGDRMIWVRASYCSRIFLDNIAEIIGNAGLTPEKLVPLELGMETLFERCCDTSDGFPMLVHLTKRNLHIMFSNGDGTYSCRSTCLKDSLNSSDIVLNSPTDGVSDIAHAMDEVVPKILNITRSSANTARNGGKCTVYFYGDRDYIMAAMEQINVSGIVTCELVQAGLFHVEMSDLSASYYINSFSAMNVVNDEELPCGLFTSSAIDTSFLSDRRVIVTIVATAIAAIFIWLYDLSLDIELKATNNDAKAYTNALSDDTVAKTLLDKQELDMEMSYYTNVNSACRDFLQYLDNDNRFNSSVVSQIESVMPPGISISNYTYNEGILTVSCVAYSQESPSTFTKLLSDSGNYQSVSYGGFTKSLDADGNDVFSFGLTINLW